MDRVERFRAAVAGAPVDRPPFTVWYHFGLQHAPAEDTARVHLQFLEAYDLDWLKVMNDYPYPMPEGIETLDDPRQLAAVTPLDPARTPLGEQLRVVERLAPALRGRAVFVDTLFDAWNTLRRNVVKGAIARFMREAPAELDRALAAVNETLVRYARASL
jgi:uroporphyrinogen decarboxylase